MRVITQLPNDDLRRAQAAARVAEAAGFDGVVALENAHGPYLPLAAAALATERVQLGTAVAMAFPGPRGPRARHARGRGRRLHRDRAGPGRGGADARLRALPDRLLLLDPSLLGRPARGNGLAALGEKLHRYPREGRWDEMAAQIPDEVIGLFAVVGTYDTIVAEIEQRYRGGADTIAFPTSPDAEPRALREVVEGIQRIPSAFTGYAVGW